MTITHVDHADDAWRRRGGRPCPTLPYSGDALHLCTPASVGLAQPRSTILVVVFTSAAGTATQKVARRKGGIVCSTAGLEGAGPAD